MPQNTFCNALLTDLYQLTMASSFYHQGFTNTEAVYHLFFRRPPFNGGFTIAAGLESVIEYIENFTFKESDIEYLRSLKSLDNVPLFKEDFLNYLTGLQFSFDIDAVEEGTCVFPYEPLLRVKGPIIQAQLLETALLNAINFPSLVATKAARICLAAENDPVIEFGLRRAQGPDGGMTASRAAFIGGCSATSNTLAGKKFGIPVKGTLAHSWIMSFEHELDAFLSYADESPTNCVLLLDTYSTVQGIENAIAVGRTLRKKGHDLLGVRLDSGDLAYLSRMCRKKLDEAGFVNTRIFATNDLNEQIISELKKQNSAITDWGVGTHLATSFDHPALDGVYKLSALRHEGEEWQYKIKLSEQIRKISNPGILQIKRYEVNDMYIADAIYDIHTNIDQGCTIVDPFDPTRQKQLSPYLKSKDLLIPIFKDGIKVYDTPSLIEMQKKTQDELHKLTPAIKRFVNPDEYTVGLEKSLYHVKSTLIQKFRNKSQ